jgi:purine-binding chemotaxis protein CheW
MVCFSTGSGPWAVAVEHAVEVRPVSAVRAMPSSRPDVAGVIDRDGTAVPVVRTLMGGGPDAGGDDGRHVLVVRAGAFTVGVIVDEVTGVVRFPDDAIGPAPAGQHDPLIGATVRGGADISFLVDVDELARSLGGQP